MLSCLPVIVAGCATQAALPAADARHQAPPPPLPQAVQALFDGAGTPSTALGTSPWGSDVVVTLGEIYPAASGRDCRTFIIRNGDDTHPGLACRADDEWAEVRVLQHRGRPVDGGAT